MIISHLNNLQIKLDEASGGAVSVELRMRLIGEMSPQVRSKLKEFVTADHQEKSKKNLKAKRESDKYWECQLYFLDSAIDQVFGDAMVNDSRQKLIEFRPFRNKLLHGNFVGLMKELAIVPTGRQILSTAGDRNILCEGDIRESLLSVERNRGLDRVSLLAREVRNILDKIIQSLV